MGFEEYELRAKRKREAFVLCAIASVLVGDFLALYMNDRVWLFRGLMFASFMTTMAMHRYITNIHFNVFGKTTNKTVLWIYFCSLANNIVNTVILLICVKGCFGDIGDDPFAMIACVAVMLCGVDLMRISNKIDWLKIFLKEDNLFEN